MDAIRTQNPRWSTPRHLRVEYSKHRFRSNLYAIYKQHPLSSPPPGGLLKGTSLTKKNPFNNSPKHHRRSSPPKHLYKKSATLPSTYRIPRRKTPNEEGKKERKEKKSKEKKRKAKKRKEKKRKEKELTNSRLRMPRRQQRKHTHIRHPQPSRPKKPCPLHPPQPWYRSPVPSYTYKRHDKSYSNSVSQSPQSAHPSGWLSRGTIPRRCETGAWTPCPRTCGCV